jgi:hypothetical protein
MTRARIAALAAGVVVLALALGCAAPRNHLYQRSGADFERALVLPLNLVVAMPEELDGPAARGVDAVLLGYLAEHGKAVETLGFADASTAWRESEAECRSQAEKKCERFANVASVMAQRLRRNHDYQTLIVPYLFLRNARTNAHTAAWDGVKRPVEKTGQGFEQEGPLRLVRGSFRAASLKVFAFSSDGEKVFEGVGGLDLVDRLDGYSEYEPYTVEVRDNLLADSAVVREGVVLALDSLVPRSEH